MVKYTQSGFRFRLGETLRERVLTNKKKSFMSKSPLGKYLGETK